MKDGNADDRSYALARGLGWFSIGLGVSQLVAPGALSRLIGVEENAALMRFLGIREAAAGVGILAQDHPTPWLWSRVAGDAMDLALLGTALLSRDSEKKSLAAATASVAAVTALDVWASVQCSRNFRLRQAKSFITINRPQTDVYEFFRDPNNLRRSMKTVPMEIEIVDARPNEFIEWRSADEWTIRSASMSFTPATGRDGTEVMAAVDGRIPRIVLHEALRRFKRLLETGEIPTTEGQPAGPSAASVAGRLIHLLERKEIA